MSLRQTVGPDDSIVKLTADIVPTLVGFATLIWNKNRRFLFLTLLLKLSGFHTSTLGSEI